MVFLPCAALLFSLALFSFRLHDRPSSPADFGQWQKPGQIRHTTLHATEFPTTEFPTTDFALYVKYLTLGPFVSTQHCRDPVVHSAYHGPRARRQAILAPIPRFGGTSFPSPSTCTANDQSTPTPSGSIRCYMPALAGIGRLLRAQITKRRGTYSLFCLTLMGYQVPFGYDQPHERHRSPWHPILHHSAEVPKLLLPIAPERSQDEKRNMLIWRICN